MKPVIYDFKRGLLRLSVLTTLVLFALAGTGLAYLTVQTLAVSRVTSAKLVAISTLNTTTGNWHFEGVVLDISSMRVLSGVLEYEVVVYNATPPQGKTMLPVTPTEVWKHRGVVQFSGFFNESAKLNLPSNITQGTYAYSVNYNITTYLGSLSGSLRYGLVSLAEEDMYCATTGGLAFHILSTTPMPGPGVAGEASILLVRPPGLGVKAAVALCTPLKGEFELYAREAGKVQMRVVVAPPSPDELKNYTFIGRIAHGVKVLDVPLNLSRQSLVEVVLVYANVTYYASSILPVEQSLGPEVFVAAPLVSEASLFAQFFPILMLYLAYVYIAKPRSQGALEFLLARPITRLEVYLTRLIAGILVAVAASALFYLTAAVTVAALTGVVLDTYTYILLYAGTVLSLIAFYNLCYALSTVLKGGRYLAISIFAYLFFAIILQILVSVLAIAVVGLGPGFGELVARLNYQAAYFSPLGIRQFFEYFTLMHYSAKYDTSLAPQVGDVVNPLLVALSAVTWITVPAVLGWLAFKRANLSG